MNIAIVSPYDFSFPGGVTSHILQMAHQFTAQGHQVKILAPCATSNGRAIDDEVIPLGRPVPVPGGGSIARISLSIWLLPRIRKLLEKENFDIVHLHEPLTPVLPFCVLYCSKAVNVGTFHAFHEGNIVYRLTQLLLNPWFNKLDGRIAVSPPALAHISKFFPGDYHIIPNGIDVDHFASEMSPVTELKDGKINILFVSRLEKRKGLRYLLDAFSRLKWDFPNIRLIVVGPGNPDKLSYRIISERNLEEDVIFTGAVSYEVLPQYYRTADIFCAPATGKESFGIVLLEAMASSKPIVATHIEGFASVLTHGQEALLVPPKDGASLADALARLIQNPDLRVQMGKRGRETVERYRWEVVALEVMDYYKIVASKRNTIVEPRTV